MFAVAGSLLGIGHWCYSLVLLILAIWNTVKYIKKEIL